MAASRQTVRSPMPSALAACLAFHSNSLASAAMGGEGGFAHRRPHRWCAHARLRQGGRSARPRGAVHAGFCACRKQTRELARRHRKALRAATPSQLTGVLRGLKPFGAVRAPRQRYSRCRSGMTAAARKRSDMRVRGRSRPRPGVNQLQRMPAPTASSWGQSAGSVGVPRPCVPLNRRPAA